MRRKLLGRHPLTLGALILLGLSVYEFWIRMEDMAAWFQGVWHLSHVRGNSFFEDLSIIFEVEAMRALAFKMIYLAAVIIFAIVCLVRRNRRRGMWVHFILAIAAAAGGILLEIYALSGWVQIIKLIPLGLIAAGSIINMVSPKKHHRELPDNHGLPPGRY